MSITLRAVHNGILHGVRRILWRHPEWWVVVVAAVAWMYMTGLIVPRASYAGIASGSGHVQGTLGIVAMVTAMMLPLTVANVRWVALSSLWRRRHRAICAFLVGYLFVWIVVQAIIVGALGLLTTFVGWVTVAGIAVVAAVWWEVSPGRRRRLRRCRRTIPLAPRGWRADADCARFGVMTGISCVMTCWALMATAAAFSHGLLVMVVLFGVQISERYQQRPSPILSTLAILGVCLLSLAAQIHHH